MINRLDMDLFCPEGFRMGEKGLAEGYRELPDYAIDDALQVAEDCPVGAIRVEK